MQECLRGLPEAGAELSVCRGQSVCGVLSRKLRALSLLRDSKGG